MENVIDIVQDAAKRCGFGSYRIESTHTGMIAIHKGRKVIYQVWFDYDLSNGYTISDIEFLGPLEERDQSFEQTVKKLKVPD